MKKIILVFLSLSLLFCLPAYANSDEMKPSFISDFIKKAMNGDASFAVLGDSITDTGTTRKETNAGGASSTDKGYAQQVASMVKLKFGDGINYKNLGVAGNSTLEAYNRIDSQIIPNNYDLVVVALGTNDWNNQLSLARFEYNYRMVLNKLITQTNANILTVGLGYFGNWKLTEKPIREESYNKIIKKVAFEYGIGYVDVRQAMKNAIDAGQTFESITYAYDPVHPNDAGHKIWADEVFKWFNVNDMLTEFKKPSFTVKVENALGKNFNYEGNWEKEGPYPSVVNDYIQVTSKPGDMLNYSFTGDKVRVYFTSDYSNGIAKISMDGVVVKTIDFYSPTYTLKPVTLNVPSGGHTLTIEVAGKNTASKGNRVGINLIEVYNSK